MIKKFFHAVMACGSIALVMSCEDQKFNNINVDVDKVELDHLTPDMIKVRDYVPEYALSLTGDRPSGPLKRRRLRIVGREKSGLTIWNVICRFRKMEWCWHCMMTT